LGKQATLLSHSNPSSLARVWRRNRRIATKYKLHYYYTLRRRPVAENRNTNG
jgi:hypothetical protein